MYGSVILFCKFVSMMLMGVMPGVRGCRNYSTVAESWWDLIMSRRPDGCQWRALSLMMCIVKVGSWNVASLGGPDNSKRNIL